MKNLGAVATDKALRSAELKVFIETYTGLEKDALHIHVALLVYLVSMFIFRQNRRSRFPWLAVLLLELTNETLDLRRNFLDLGRPADLGLLSWRESVKDLWNTMLWPSVLLIIGRYTRLFVPNREPAKTRRPATKQSLTQPFTEPSGNPS